MKTEPTVFVVDDDQAVREALSFRLKSVGMNVETCGSAQEFLEVYDTDQPGCLVLDVRMPGMSGIELHKKLLADDIGIPVIIITGHGDIPMAVRAVQEGAMDFIPKPFKDQELLARIREALEHDACLRQEREERSTIATRVASLTPRERDVMDRVVAGKTTKQIAAEYGASHQAVDAHRSRIMKKMQVTSVAELVQLVLEAQSE